MDSIRHSLKKYVQLQNEYKLALKIVQRHKQLQERLKNLFTEAGIDEYTISEPDCDATLQFRSFQTTRIDTSALPEDIRRQYTRKVKMRKEYLTIRKP